MNIYQSMGMKRIINCSGKMTYLGSSLLDDSVSDAMKEASKGYVYIEELINKASEILANYTSSEAACVCAGASAGIIIATAALVTRGDKYLVEQVPYVNINRKKILIAKGHSINFGAPITQMISIGGGIPIEFGTVNRCLPYHLENLIDEDVAGIVYVKSHHCVQTEMLSIEETIEIAKKYDVPVIIDAAAEEDLTKYIKCGFDLVIYSGAKAFEGPTSGFIAGKKQYIDMCRKQYSGVARPMKVGKENIVGLLTAIQNYHNNNKKIEKQLLIVNNIIEALKDINGLKVSISKDSSGREIYRAKIELNQDILKISAAELEKQLKSGDDIIFVRNHNVNIGYIQVDPRPMQVGDEKYLIDAILKIIK